MSQAPLMLGVSGLRGIVGQSLTPEVAMRYAAAFGTWLRRNVEDEVPDVVIGRDGRAGGEMIHHAAIAGLLASGCRVIDLGIATTPTVGIADGACVQGGMVVTASHNPQEWNGLKCLVQSYNDRSNWVTSANAPTAAQAAEIIDIFESGPEIAEPLPNAFELNTRAAETHRRDVYLALMNEVLTYDIERRMGDEGLGLRFVVDAVNASGSTISIPFLEELGHVVALFCDNSGIFPHPPEPTKENLSGEGGLCDAVPGLKADIGFAQDPDADRLAIVDELGNYIGEEYTLVFAAEALLQAREPASPTRKRGKDSPESSSSPKNLARASGSQGMIADIPPGTPIICVNLSTSRMIDDVAARHGARVVRTPVGEANVVEMMKKLRSEGHEVILGGEGNGGVIWPRVTYVRDSLSAMALTLALMARTGKTISQLVADMPSYAIVKRKRPLASKADAEPAIERIARAYANDPNATIDTQDGVRIDWPDRWVHVRASNTEPILRLIAESPSQGESNELLDQAAELAG